MSDRRIVILLTPDVPDKNGNVYTRESLKEVEHTFSMGCFAAPPKCPICEEARMKTEEISKDPRSTEDT